MNGIILSTSFFALFFIIPFFTIFSPITVVGLIFTIYFTNNCYKNISKIYDDTKHQKLLKWLNIFYMPFYFFRMVKKGWLYNAENEVPNKK
jgi:hypothetical protein